MGPTTGLLKRFHISYITKKPEGVDFMERPVCVECKDQEARFWGDMLCEDCLRELLQEEK